MMGRFNEATFVETDGSVGSNDPCVLECFRWCDLPLGNSGFEVFDRRVKFGEASRDAAGLLLSKEGRGREKFWRLLVEVDDIRRAWF